MQKVLIAAAMVALPGAVDAQTLVNGGFEAPVVTDPCCVTSPPTPIPGWTATPNVNVVNGTFSSSAGQNLAYQGNQYLDLVGEGGTGSISQSFTTVQGQQYTLTFAYSHNLFAGLGSASARLSVGSLSDSFTHSTGSNANLDWRLYTGTFIAQGTSTTLSFVNTVGGQNEGVFLDAVAVNAVPEPASWAMMIGGFALMGGALRRRAKPAAAHA